MALGEQSSAETAEARLINASELAERLNISTRTLWRLLSAGKIPKPIRLGGCTRWRVDQVQRWIGRDCPDQSAEAGSS